MQTPPSSVVPNIARVYLRVSTETQDLRRQEQIVENAKASGYYVAGIYREKASGARADRPELQRLIGDLQPGETIVAEKIDRLSRLPLKEAEKLIASIRDRGAKLAIPGIVDLSQLAEESDGIAKVVLESVQEMLLKLALQIARDDYEIRRERQRQGVDLAKVGGRYQGRRADARRQVQVVELRIAGHSIGRTATLTGYSTAQVKRIWAKRRIICE